MKTIIFLPVLIVMLRIGACFNCGPNCSQCSSEGCVTCMYSNIFCPDKCSTCQNASNCTKCLQGYYLSEGSCAFCGLGCQTCTDIVGCTICSNSISGCFNYGYSPSSSSPITLDIGLIVGSTIGGISIIIIIVVIICKRRRSSSPFLDQERGVEFSTQQITQQLKGKIEWKKEQFDKAMMDEDCTICQTPEPNVMTSCRHIYHHLCLNEWIRRKHTCPMCRKQGINEIKIICMRCKQHSFERSLRGAIVILQRQSSVCPSCL